MRIAILDDYQGCALELADWSRIQKEHEVIAFRDHIFDDDKLIERLIDFDVICMMRERTPIMRPQIERLPKLKLLITTGAYNASLDTAAARERGITVCGTRSSGHATAELTIGLIIALSRRIVDHHLSVRNGGWQVGLGEDIRGKTLGVIGLGKLGQQVTNVCSLLGMKPIAWSQNLTKEKAEAGGAELVTKNELFERADFITIHYKLSERSAGLVGASEIGRMKPTAFLINTSRGPLIDDAALIDALKNERIGGAALDAFDIEPLPADHPYRTLPRLLTTPHVGYVSLENYKDYFREIVESIEAWLDGKPIREM